jgi:hypothetical protein
MPTLSHKCEWFVATLAALTIALFIPVMGWLVGGVVFSLCGWLDRPCEIIGTEEVRSPDNRWNAIARTEACGGAVGTLNQNVYLAPVRSTGPLTPKQRVLDGEPISDPQPIGLVWSNRNELTVTMPPGIIVTRREHAKDDVTLLYKSGRRSEGPAPP